jgi:hypothetical protein
MERHTHTRASYLCEDRQTEVPIRRLTEVAGLASSVGGGKKREILATSLTLITIC